MFNLVSKYTPSGDQPQAIEKLVKGIKEGQKEQVLLGATGTGKTFTIANVIKEVNKPTLVLAHNKTLAGQLYSELKELFPENRVEYFVSYYDYYQPEAYVPSSDTFIEKDASINDEIDELRHSATSALISRDDVIVVASVSCIYGLGEKEEYENKTLSLKVGDVIDRDQILEKLVEMLYERNNMDLVRGTFRTKGDTIEVVPAYSRTTAYRIDLFGDEVEKLIEFDTTTGAVISQKQTITIFAASHFVTSEDKLKLAVKNIKEELRERLAYFKANNKLLELQRLEQRTNYDIEMMEETGFCKGIENYSRHLAFRKEGETPTTLLDFFPDDYLMVIDESHVTLPQVRAMYNGDRMRKSVLVEYGFRLPSALDNRPLKFDEFEKKIGAGNWLKVAAEGWGYGTAYTYVSAYTGVGNGVHHMEDVWVDGRYVNKNNGIDLKATYAQHPTSDILVRNKTFTNASGKTVTQDVLYEYDAQRGGWYAVKSYYGRNWWYSDSYDKLPADMKLSKEQVANMRVDSNAGKLPETGLIYDGTVAPGTPFFN